MIKVGIITSSLEKTSGWGRYSFEITEALRKNAEVKVISRPVLPSPLSHPLKRLMSLPKIIKDLRDCDIIHCLVEPYAFLAALAARFLRKPLVVNGVGTYAVAPLNTAVEGAILKYAYRHAAKILCISKFTEQAILKRVPLENTAVVNLGVDNAKFQGTFNKKAAGKTIISVGALKDRKGYHIAIPAVAKVKGKYPDLRYFIVGDQSSKAYFEELKKTAKDGNLDNSVVFLENVPDEELIALYHQADLFLLTPVNVNDNFEGFGLVYLEANACGLPAIGSRDCGAEDIIKEGYNGLLVPQKDIEATGKAILTLLDDPALSRKMGENGRKVASAMSWENTIKRYLEIYQSILSTKL